MTLNASNRSLVIALLLAAASWACGSGEQSLALGDGVSTESTTDGVKNGNESDVDCGGGGGAPLCANGKSCVSDCDCASGTCQGYLCVAASCTDGVKNGNETDVDCGGPDCRPCRDGYKCSVLGTAVGDKPNPVLIARGLSPIAAGARNDCVSTMGCWPTVPGGQPYCRQPNTCTNTHFEAGLGETSLDCGGPCKACAAGLVCLINEDCQSKLCVGGVCAPSSCNDGVKNGNETGVDCGGSCAPCTAGEICGGGAPSLTACAANLKCSCGSCTPKVNLCKGVPCPAPASDCQLASCDPADGACFNSPKADGTPCSSAAPAGGTASCHSGVCKPTWVGTTVQIEQFSFRAAVSVEEMLTTAPQGIHLFSNVRGDSTQAFMFEGRGSNPMASIAAPNPSTSASSFYDNGDQSKYLVQANYGDAYQGASWDFNRVDDTGNLPYFFYPGFVVSSYGTQTRWMQMITNSVREGYGPPPDYIRLPNQGIGQASTAVETANLQQPTVNPTGILWDWEYLSYWHQQGGPSPALVQASISDAAGTGPASMRFTVAGGHAQLHVFVDEGTLWAATDDNGDHGYRYELIDLAGNEVLAPAVAPLPVWLDETVTLAPGTYLLRFGAVDGTGHVAAPYHRSVSAADERFDSGQPNSTAIFLRAEFLSFSP